MYRRGNSGSAGPSSPNHGGQPRRVTGIRLEGVPPMAVTHFARGAAERYPAGRMVLTDDNPA